MKKNLLLSLLSVVLLSLPWLGFSGILLLGAFVPLLLIREDLQGRLNKKGRQKKFIFYPLVIFALWAVADTWWIALSARVDPGAFAGAVASPVINTLLATSAFMLFHYVAKHAPKPLAYTVLVTAWISLEYLYLTGEISFPWLALGNGFANDVILVQWYEYTGAFGASLWVMVSNILIFELIRRAKYRGGMRRPVIYTLSLVLIPMVVSAVMYYSYKEKTEPVTVHIVQPNIDPINEKFGSVSQAQQQEIILRLAATAPADVDFIVAPETAIEDDIDESDIADSEAFLHFRGFMSGNYPSAAFILGASTYKYYYDSEPTSTASENGMGAYYDSYNTALLIDSSSMPQIYHKEKLVVGAEKFPYPKFFNMLGTAVTLDLGGMSGNLGRDNTSIMFSSPRGVRFGAPICLESIYGAFFSRWARQGAQIMFVITNDGWWGDTPGYRQHFSFARLRAIETRRSIAHSANTGISGIINQRGDVVKREGWNVRTTVTGKVNLNDKITFYTKYGDVIAKVSVYVLALCLLYFIAYRFRKKDHIA